MTYQESLTDILVYGIVIVALLCAITGITTGNNIIAWADENTKQINEDQFIVCNFENVCQIINADDYMSKKSVDNLWNNFNKNLDTFDLKEYSKK